MKENKYRIPRRYFRSARALWRKVASLAWWVSNCNGYAAGKAFHTERFTRNRAAKLETQGLLRKEKLPVTEGYERQAGGGLVKARWRMAARCRPEGTALPAHTGPVAEFWRETDQVRGGLGVLYGSKVGGGPHREGAVDGVVGPENVLAAVSQLGRPVIPFHRQRSWGQEG